MKRLRRRLFAACLFVHQLHQAEWGWFSPRANGATCSAWALWLAAIQLPPWGLGVIRESWGLRIMLVRWQLVAHFPKELAPIKAKLLARWPFNRRTAKAPRRSRPQGPKPTKGEFGRRWSQQPIPHNDRRCEAGKCGRRGLYARECYGRRASDYRRQS
ncbi:MAG: hypothetical protein Q8O14_14710 [bacterium]|nr:hypothetical protein [bacterium]